MVITQPEGDIATASLDFDEFSFWNTEHQTMENISKEHTTALLTYLSKNYRIFEIQVSFPYLILFCRDGIPPQEKRPLSIAGCIAVWLNEDDAVPGDVSIGDFGECDDIVIEQELAADLRSFSIPKDSTLLRVATRYFPDASFISYISHSMIVEYATEDEDTWYNRLEKLPNGFQNVGVALSFVNGPLVATELERIKALELQKLSDVQKDDSDYVKSQGCFFPGTMLRVRSGNQRTAGIAVTKGLETRLTVGFPSWDKECETISEISGDETHFSVTQAETPVGYVCERTGTTDIGLAQLKNDIIFHNRFLDIPTTAKVLLSSRDIKFNDEFFIDSFVTRRQRLRCQGLRIGIENHAKEVMLNDDKEHPPATIGAGAGASISLRQGIYATGSLSEIHHEPRIRAGVCGSALVRLRKADGEATLQKGEISGFMHWSDLQLKNDTSGRLLCFADAVDDLVDAGWTIVSGFGKERRDIRRKSQMMG
ncbi:hypothetical protein MMC12_006979 [Toensbergia leucococca]|nr:hypothetical protein [Toensbergia leucococca]